MNSTTGDFSQLRTTVDSDSLRVSQSSVKRLPRLPRKLIKITPLNLNEIRKEVEGVDKFEEQPIVCFKTDSTTTREDRCENILRDISNNVTDKHNEEFPSYKTPMKNSVPVPHTTKKNDSFDIDFSALSLVTPVKEIETTYVTPRVTKLPVCSERQIIKFNSFVTPKINNVPPKNLYSISKTSHHHGLCSKMSVSNKIATPSIEEEPFNVSKECEEKLTDNLEIQAEDSFPFERLKVKNVEYVILNTLGQGGSSEVFAGFCTKDKRHVAIKCVSLQNSATAVGYVNEVKLLQRLQDCDKIIKMYDYEILEKEKKLLVVLEKGSEDLSTILKNLATLRSHIPVYILIFYWMEMLNAVKQMHSCGVIHADLKPANFLRDMSGLKLIDFGIASLVENDMTSVIKNCPEGSCNYISPEALMKDTSSTSSPKSVKYKLHYKSDVWSLGCILYQLVYKKTPFHHVRPMWQKLAYITNPNHVIEFPEAKWVPPMIIDTIKKVFAL